GRGDHGIAELGRRRRVAVVDEADDRLDLRDGRPVEAIARGGQPAEVRKLLDLEIGVDREIADRIEHRPAAAGDRDADIAAHRADVARDVARAVQARAEGLARKIVGAARHADAGGHVARRQLEQRAVGEELDIADLGGRLGPV
ncbi:hypothetical protein QU38_01345, partial [Staphylococcus aureus]